MQQSNVTGRVKKAAYLSAHRGEQAKAMADECGVSVAALLDVLVARAHDEGIPEDLVRHARRIDHDSRSRRGMRRA